MVSAASAPKKARAGRLARIGRVASMLALISLCAYLASSNAVRSFLRELARLIDTFVV